MEDDIMKKIYDDIEKHDKEVHDHNASLINSFGKTANKHFEDLMDFCYVTGKIELVDKPDGDKQHENYGVFKNVHVQQWSTGPEGDSFAGFIYAKAKSQWIKIPYSC